MNQKLQLILLNAGIIALVSGTLYWCSNQTEKKHKETIEFINKDFKYSKGIITDLRSYKGQTVEIKYRVNDVDYKVIRGWDTNINSLDEGDSLRIRYSLEQPELIISELEDEY